MNPEHVAYIYTSVAWTLLRNVNGAWPCGLSGALPFDAIERGRQLSPLSD